MTSKKKKAASCRKAAKKPKSAAKKMPKIGDTKKPLIRVLIADDHSVVREGLVSLITRKADMTVVGEAGNGREAVDFWRAHHPDVALRETLIVSTCRVHDGETFLGVHLAAHRAQRVSGEILSDREIDVLKLMV